MPKKKKKNPNRIPLSNLQRISKERSDAIRLVYIIFLSVLFDKFGMSVIEIKKVYDEAISLSESIAKGYVNVKDLIEVLRNEYGIKI